MLITDLQILKRTGELHVDKMRAIQLYVAEKNMTNKHLGRAILAHAEKAKAIYDNQCGSRKSHKAIMARLNKELIMDIFRQKRHAGAIGIINAKGCFNHIVHTVAIIVLLSFGMLSIGLRELFECIQNSDHHIKTSYGVSKPAYGKTDPPSQGVGQGIAFGPSLWTVISSKMIE